MSSLPGLRSRLSGAHARLLALYALATIPLMLLLGYSGFADWDRTLANGRSQLQMMADYGARMQDAAVNEAANLLGAMALLPEVVTGGPTCHATLLRLDTENTRVQHLFVARPDGTMICSSRTDRPDMSLADRAYFRDAMANPAVASEVLTSRMTGMPTFTVARAVPAPDNPMVRGVIGASLDVNWLAQLPSQGAVTLSPTIGIIDLATGQIVGSSLPGDAVDLAGLSRPHILREMRETRRGAMEMPGNEEALFAYAELNGQGGRLAIVVGVPRSQVLSASRFHLTISALAAATAALAALMASWLAADRWLLKPLSRLAQAARANAQGALGTCVGALPGAVRELKLFGEGFDTMARTLLERDARIAQSEAHHRLLADHSGDMITRFDPQFRRSYISPACEEILGYTPDEFLAMGLEQVVVAEDLPRLQAELVQPLLAGVETARSTYRCRHRNGGTVWIEASARRLPDGAGFMAVARDVSLQKALEAQLEAANERLRVQASTDALTGLANRRQFDEALNVEWRRSLRLEEPMSVLLADIDHFKSFNDTFGHAVGDTCLKGVATALSQVVRRPTDLASRYGGEEFAILLPGTTQDGALMVAERLRGVVRAVSQTLPGANERPLTISIGSVTLMPRAGAPSPAKLMEAADAALYIAKRSGRDQVVCGRPPEPVVTEPV